MISLIYSFGIVSVVILDPEIFFCVVDAAAVSHNGIKTLLANGLSTFFINSKPVFSNGS